MRGLLWTILVVLGFVSFTSVRHAFRYPHSETELIAVISTAGFFAIVTMLIVLRTAPLLRDLRFIRMYRLWADAKESELKRRAEQTKQ